MTALNVPKHAAMNAPAASAPGTLTAALAFPGSKSRLGKGRPARVLILVIAIAALGLGDLYMTTAFLTSGGMSEGNPIARWIMSFNCVWLLSAWKVMLLGVTCLLLLVTRRSRAAEIAAWLCAAVMLWLAVRWMAYAELAPMASSTMLQCDDTRPHDWVSIDTSPATR